MNRFQILTVTFLAAAFAVAGCAAAQDSTTPPYPYRLVWIWGGLSTAKEDLMAPDRSLQHVALARQLQSMNVNGLAMPIRLQDRAADPIPQLRSLSEFLSSYGIGLYTYVPYGSGLQGASSGKTNCPFSPGFARHWDDLADRLFTGVPLLKGYIVKGLGYERVPGPLDCQCDVCKPKPEPERVLTALSAISRSVGKHKGVIFYRTWTTGALQDKECRLFSALAGKLPENVFLVSKIGYGDFGIKEIPHPLFGRVKPRSQHIAEFQIYGEYHGRHYSPCEMVTSWTDWMRQNKSLIGGFVGDLWVDGTNLDHPLNLVNWYAFGRLASNPDASADQIIRSWAGQTYGKQAADAVAAVLRRTSVAATKMNFFKGVWVQQHSWLPTRNYLDSHLRGPWVDMKRDEKLIGWGRPLDLFPAEQAATYAADPDLDLFTHRRAITPELMGELRKQQDEGVNEYERMLADWRKASPLIPKAQHEPVEQRLAAALDDARVRRLNTQAYVSWLLGKDHRPFVEEMQRLAAGKNGTALIQQEVDKVIRSYR